MFMAVSTTTPENDMMPHAMTDRTNRASTRRSNEVLIGWCFFQVQTTNTMSGSGRGGCLRANNQRRAVGQRRATAALAKAAVRTRSHRGHPMAPGKLTFMSRYL